MRNREFLADGVAEGLDIFFRGEEILIYSEYERKDLFMKKTKCPNQQIGAFLILRCLLNIFFVCRNGQNYAAVGGTSFFGIVAGYRIGSTETNIGDA